MPSILTGLDYLAHTSRKMVDFIDLIGERLSSTGTNPTGIHKSTHCKALVRWRRD